MFLTSRALVSVRAFSLSMLTPSAPNLAVSVLFISELLEVIIGPNGYPPKTTHMVTPHRIPAHIGSSDWFVTECFIHPSQHEQYRQWITLCASLAGVCKALHALILPLLLHDIWIEHPWRMKQFLRGFDTTVSGAREARLRLVRNIRVAWPIPDWDGMYNHHMEDKVDIEGWQDWPIDVDLIPLGYVIGAPHTICPLWQKVESLYHEMMASLPALDGFDGGFHGMGSFISTPTLPGCLLSLAKCSRYIRSLRLNTHAHHQELYDALTHMPFLEEIMFEFFMNPDNEEPLWVTQIKLPHLETCVLIFPYTKSAFLPLFEKWDLPRLKHLAVRFQGCANPDLSGILSRHGPHLLVLEIAAVWSSDSPELDIYSYCGKLRTLSLDWSGCLPSIPKLFSVEDLVLHHTTGPVCPLKDSDEWPFEAFLIHILCHKPYWDGLRRITDTSLYHSPLREQRESLIRWVKCWAAPLAEEDVTCLDAYGTNILDIALNVLPGDDVKYRPGPMAFLPAWAQGSVPPRHISHIK
ncbi:hypothetical protein M422DRAFT_56363 [Sphaerobolus stellatus SS14]|uniref:Uncharacterized protein n=1 Tax=Sphaerobolus stellatus (strain SS14) TaxID=990650 RepID=A0A0C9TRQ1_SPHS4|nr:hypothetical protein M422DRAFT_56363 [Sphaerobolus stellatus SS14]